MAGLIRLEVSGIRDVQGRFARATVALQVGQRDEMRTLGRKAVDALRRAAPVRTGKLRAGIRYNTRATATNTQLSVTSAAPYTKWVIYGRGPVVAIHAKALRFQPVVGGPFIFRKRVGPSKPNPFHRVALAALGDEPWGTARRIAARIETAYTAR